MAGNSREPSQDADTGAGRQTDVHTGHGVKGQGGQTESAGVPDARPPSQDGPQQSEDRSLDGDDTSGH